ncbi:MAG: hypothetical protein IH586_01975 [Anaerolineaceae bacterium]|nr:hypothetical protein [Anaerolineaceae bacterium]
MSQDNYLSKNQSDQEDYYLSQSKALVAQYLADHDLTHEMLRSMPEKQSREILKQALDFAAQYIARFDSMVHLGHKDTDAVMEEQPRKRSIDRLAVHFKQTNKS